MHTASSPCILPREESCANFSAHSRLKKPPTEQKNSPSPLCSLTVIILSSAVNPCLSPSLRQRENMDETSAASLPIPNPSLELHHPNSGCVHFLWSVHPLSLESDVPSSLHRPVLYVKIYTLNYTLVSKTVCMQATAANRRAAAIFFTPLDGFTDFWL